MDWLRGSSFHFHALASESSIGAIYMSLTLAKGFKVSDRTRQANEAVPRILGAVLEAGPGQPLAPGRGRFGSAELNVPVRESQSTFNHSLCLTIITIPGPGGPAGPGPEGPGGAGRLPVRQGPGAGAGGGEARPRPAGEMLKLLRS